MDTKLTIRNGYSSVEFSSSNSLKCLLPSSPPWIFFRAPYSPVRTCDNPGKARKSQEMASKRECRACRKSFSPDYRNQADQAFCPRPECRRFRRAEAQRKRRNRPGQDHLLTRRLKPSEARWLRKNPMVVGLVSVLIGSTDWQDIEAFCAAAALRGRKILDGPLVGADENGLKNKGHNGARPPMAHAGLGN